MRYAVPKGIHYLLLSLPQEERYNTQSAAADRITWEKSHGRYSPGGHDAG
jgi:hypothetical protein